MTVQVTISIFCDRCQGLVVGTASDHLSNSAKTRYEMKKAWLSAGGKIISMASNDTILGRPVSSGTEAWLCASCSDIINKKQ